MFNLKLKLITILRAHQILISLHPKKSATINQNQNAPLLISQPLTMSLKCLKTKTDMILLGIITTNIQSRN